MEYQLAGLVRRGGWDVQAMFQGRPGIRRKDVYIRHLIKKRWETLGVWNPRVGCSRPRRRGTAGRDMALEMEVAGRHSVARSHAREI